MNAYIDAIKIVRSKFGIPLKEAKDFIDQIAPMIRDGWERKESVLSIRTDEDERLRDQFAMAVLPKTIDSFEKYTDEQISHAVRMSGVGEGSPMELVIAIGAYRMADAMLQARGMK